MRVLICGDREYTEIQRIIDYLIDLDTSNIECVIEGEARGADSLGRLAAEKFFIEVEKYPADWDKYGKAAGPIRNQQMLDEGNPDIVLAFHHDIAKSKGTKDMIFRANKAGIPVRLCP